jgi:uncharacterized protein
MSEQIQELKNPKLKVTSFNPDERYLYDVDSGKVEWPLPIISELEVDLNDEETLEKSSIKAQLQMLRKVEKPFGDHLIIRGKVQVRYTAPCVRCLRPTLQKAESKISAAYLHPSLEKQPEFEELTAIFSDSSELDLYFHEKGVVDLEELIHEHIFMSVDPLPLHDPDCKGLCFQCGADLNTEQCKHSQ